MLNKFNDLKNINNKTIKQVNNLEIRVQNLEQYSRRNSIRIFGIPEQEGENADLLIVNLSKNHMNYDMQQYEIDKSHRIGSKITYKDKCRPILVKFARYKTKEIIFSNKKKLKGTKITIKEDLFKSRFEIYNAAVEKYGFKSVWTSNGRIKVYTTSENKRDDEKKSIVRVLNSITYI